MFRKLSLSEVKFGLKGIAVKISDIQRQILDWTVEKKSNIPKQKLGFDIEKIQKISLQLWKPMLPHPLL